MSVTIRIVSFPNALRVTDRDAVSSLPGNGACSQELTIDGAVFAMVK
jgi:hypothetical protein